ncbi:cob(I)yrinic acid a,c-diamide adenosyltransferase [Clostridium sp. UBA6640]|uniref:cob(I)yrinic acid a,c-diamide adenosyltransferase n=1 Tax=Clostridium sp. UBA6640 TaxID=1946370 RepID=UPI0025BCB4D8|nr:cob(I)yrinic acid a,c-diamide adenosyltransferase [Clostridium sp. UBA6640]
MSYIHVYTGNGKGKTTAAFGVALRTLFNGGKVYVGQFVKDMKYSETNLEKHFSNITIEQFGDGCIIDRNPSERDKNLAKAGLNKMKDILTSEEYDLVIFDEITIALYFKFLTIEEILETLNHKDEKCEIIITGRYAPEELIAVADLVTEMKEVKHYYTKGVLSRKGIDC